MNLTIHDIAANAMTLRWASKLLDPNCCTLLLFCLVCAWTEGDPLGNCCVTPACYSHLTDQLLQLAGGRLVLALEGCVHGCILVCCCYLVCLATANRRAGMWFGVYCELR